MTEATDFEIHIRRGLGPLKFGMTREQVARHRSAFGDPEVAASGTSDAVFEDTMEMLKRFMAAEDLAAARSAHERSRMTPVAVSEVYQQYGLVLDYEGDHLSLIQMDPKAAFANLDGQPLFGMPTLDVLRLLERRNGQAGQFRSSYSDFDAIAIYLVEFSAVTPGNSVRATGSNELSFGQRVIAIRPQPIAPDAAWPKIRYSFLQ